MFTSSIAVYGQGQVPMTEDLVPQPEDPYGISKYAVELDLKAAHEMFGLDYVVFRPHNVYGERQNIADQYRNVIGIFMNQLLQGQPMTVFGDGLQTRAFSHVDDVAPVIARSPLVPAAYNEVFNIGADTPYTILQLAEEIAAAFGKPADVKHLPARNEVVHAFSDHSQVRRRVRPAAADRPADRHPADGRVGEVARPGHAGPVLRHRNPGQASRRVAVVSRPLRVLVATRHLDIVGGIETYLRVVLPWLASRKCELAILAECGDPASGIVAGCQGVSIWTTNGSSIEELLAKVKQWTPDVVYAHGLGDPELEAALADRFPTVLYAHYYYGTCVSGTKCHASPRDEPCQRRFGLGCLVAYYPRRCGGRNPLTMLREYRSQRLRARTLDRYKAILVASRHMANEYRRHGISEDRLRLVPLFPTDLASDRTSPLPRSRSDRVLFVGRMTPLKGLAHLRAALPIASEVLGRQLTLVVAGNGPDLAAAKAEPRRDDVPIEFLDWIGPERREAEMRAADVLAVPSLWPEPFGLVGIEAGCVGLPAVAYAVGGIPDWLEPGVSGESVPGRATRPA